MLKEVKKVPLLPPTSEDFEVIRTILELLPTPQEEAEDIPTEKEDKDRKEGK